MQVYCWVCDEDHDEDEARYYEEPGEWCCNKCRDEYLEELGGWR